MKAPAGPPRFARTTPVASLGGGRFAPPGLRLQIVLALAGIILVAYVPLFFAIAQVTRATSQSYREDSARSIGRAVAARSPIGCKR